jgi:hypothetical protein
MQAKVSSELILRVIIFSYYYFVICCFFEIFKIPFKTLILDSKMNDLLPEIIEFDDRKYLVQIMPNNPGNKIIILNKINIAIFSTYNLTIL